MYQVIKRVFDIFFALLGLICTSPFWLIAFIGIIVSDWGPIFYKANRIGKGNKLFKMYKFRSMKVFHTTKSGSEASLRPDEDRFFAFGRFIRKVKIDELPQLLNVLNGAMSIIGPRPVAQDQFELFRTGKWNLAAQVSAGLSGPAALYDFIYGDQFTDEKEYMEKVFETRRELEYVYVKKAGLLYDLKMIVYTVICIFYAFIGKECKWILKELIADAEQSKTNENE